MFVQKFCSFINLEHEINILKNDKTMLLKKKSILCIIIPVKKYSCRNVIIDKLYSLNSFDNGLK